MAVSYDTFIGAFLDKVQEYDFPVDQVVRNHMVDGYMKRAIAEFRSVCLYDLSTTAEDEIREFMVDIPEDDLEELADIISEGMLVQWMKPYIYRTENLENALNTKDFTTYSPANLLYRMSEAYKVVKRDYTNMIREYSYVHGDLSDLHL